MTEPETTASLEAPAEPDPLQELQKLRDVNRRWRRAAVGTVFAFVFLFVLSCVQFLGTFVTCRLLHESRQEAARARQDTLKALAEIKDTREDLRKVRTAVSNYLVHEQAKEKFEEMEMDQRLTAIKAELEQLAKAKKDAEASKNQTDIERYQTEAYAKRLAELNAEKAKLEDRIKRWKQNKALVEMMKTEKVQE